MLDIVNDLKDQESGNKSHRQDHKDDLGPVGLLVGLVHRDLPPGVPDRLPVPPPPPPRLGHQLVSAVPRVHADLKGTVVTYYRETDASIAPLHFPTATPQRFCE